MERLQKSHTYIEAEVTPGAPSPVLLIQTTIGAHTFTSRLEVARYPAPFGMTLETSIWYVERWANENGCRVEAWVPHGNSLRAPVVAR